MMCINQDVRLHAGCDRGGVCSDGAVFVVAKAIGAAVAAVALAGSAANGGGWGE